HVTRYDYASEVLQARHWLHLRPRDHAFQKVTAQGLLIDPAPTEIVSLHDAFGNGTVQANIDRPHAWLDVAADMKVTLQPRPVIDAGDTQSWESVRDALSYSNRPRTETEIEALGYRMESPQIRIKKVFGELGLSCFGKDEPILAGAINLMHKLFETLTYKPGATSTATPLTQILEKREGVCQDYAHLMIACMRSLGLPARYVSGYLRTAPLDKDKAARSLIGADASHAWVAVYVPTLGWIELDPTNNMIVSTDHIALGWGRDFSDVSPLRGVITGGGEHTLSVAVSVVPLAA
ncbi:MAG: transglutaminase family protein, partial [Steroidobacter sp.]